MTMKIKVVADSACDLPQELMKRYDISLIPLRIRMGEKEYLDGVEVAPQDIFDHVDGGGDLCGTVAINPETYVQSFRKYVSDYDAVVCVNIGSGFSSCCQNAQVAAQDFSNVHVVDSRGLSSGEGLIALEAARLAEAGLTPEEICARLERDRERVSSSFLLDRLDYMKKGGRCNAVTALGANLLQLKPCIRVREGRMEVGKKYRGTMEKAMVDYVTDLLAQCETPRMGEVIVVHPPARASAVQAAKDALERSGRVARIWEADCSCTIACHCGPNTIGVMFLPEAAE